MSKSVIAIDPGPVESAYVVFGADGIAEHAKIDNEWLIELLGSRPWRPGCDVVIEMITHYGLPVGMSIYDTCVIIGRLMQASAHGGRGIPARVGRGEIKTALCRTRRANDSAVRRRIIELYGGKARAVGTKARPGPLYGIHGDVWAALALAIIFFDGTKGGRG